MKRTLPIGKGIQNLRMRKKSFVFFTSKTQILFYLFQHSRGKIEGRACRKGKQWVFPPHELT